MAKINKLESLQVGCIVLVVGFLTFFTGLKNQFQGDDNYQIVNNTPVHSITHLFQFFESSTFYNGQKLTGIYYRPMMSTVFSLIYTFFGAHPITYHIVQLALYIASAFLFYLILRRFIKPILALSLALIFLVHPLNTQVVYSIPTMQDVLFLFFGELAIWILITYKSTRGLLGAASCLFLAMLSKETALIFIILALLYVFWFDRKRFRAFAAVMVAPVVLYAVLKINAVGLNATQHAGSIDNASLIARLYTAPSIVWFYITKFVFPWKLATGYYWVYPKFSVVHVLLPLLADMAIFGLIIYGALRMRSSQSKSAYHAYLFFAAWAILAVLPYLQIIPLDMTFSESWFYFSMAGLLGLIGVTLHALKIRFRPEIVMAIVIALICILGVRSAVRGKDYTSQYELAVHDIAVSSNNYSALSNISQYLIDHGQYKEAAVYAQRSINIYPVVSNYINLGAAREYAGNYNGAVQAYNQALKYGNLSIIYENLSLIYLVYNSPPFTAQFFQKAINEYPHDFKLWLYLAVFEGALGSNNEAKSAIQNAAKYGTVPPGIYNNIMQGQAFPLPLLGKTIVV